MVVLHTHKLLDACYVKKVVKFAIYILNKFLF